MFTIPSKCYDLGFMVAVWNNILAFKSPIAGGSTPIPCVYMWLQAEGICVLGHTLGTGAGPELSVQPASGDAILCRRSRQSHVFPVTGVRCPFQRGVEHFEE